MIELINPKKIKKEAFPLFVLSDDLRGFFSLGIRIHSEGNYSHIMSMTIPSYFDTQGFLFKRVKVEKYMTGRHRLKFWQPRGLTGTEKLKVIEAIEKDLKAPWWERKYDVLGVIGQLFRIRWINNPFTYYCSERIAKYARLIDWLKDKIPLRPSPSKINRIFKTVEKMGVYGYYEKDKIKD